MTNPQFKNELDGPIVVPRNLSLNDLREWIKLKMDEIDSVKRSITEQMSRYHDETIASDRTREFYSWIRLNFVSFH